MTTETFPIIGMHCASCAGIIEKTLKKTTGVESAEVNYGTETAKITFDNSKTKIQTLSKQIEPLGYSIKIPEDHSKHLGMNETHSEKLEELSNLKINVISIIPLTLFSIFVMTWDILAELGRISPPSYTIRELFHHLLPIFATYALFVVGKPYLLGLYRFFRHGAANMDTLIGLGTSAAFLYSLAITAFEETLRPFINVNHTYYDVTIVVIAFITFGKYLEARSKLKTGDAIEKLLNLQAKTALMIHEGVEMEMPVEHVKVGDTIIVKPGGKIPVDGVVIDGTSFVDEALVTGEPMPVEKKLGDTVIAGTLNTAGTFMFRATKVGSETMLAHIIKMVRDAQGSKAPIQALADKISSVFVPTVLVIAFVTLAAWILVGTQYFGFAQALSYGLTSFVGVLIIACPCALGLATPTAIIVGVGKGARAGILIKDAATLQKLHKVTTIVVDKTGTITRGKPEFISLANFSDKSDLELMSIIASLENKSEHPIAHAILTYAAEKNIPISTLTQFEALRGKGVRGTLAGTEYVAGSLALIHELGLNFNTTRFETEARTGKTPLIIASRTAVLGVCLVADAIKPEAAAAIKDLRALGVTVLMVTGDTKNTAEYIAAQVGITSVIAEASPERKLDTIKELQSRGIVVAMAGDGVNDAPALAQADVGIAMATGIDVAIETAGITLLHGDISKIVQAIRLSKMTMTGIKQNLFWAFAYNVIGIPLAAGLFYPVFGWLLNPVFAGLAMAFSSVSVVGNSLRIKTKKL